MRFTNGLVIFIIAGFYKTKKIIFSNFCYIVHIGEKRQDLIQDIEPRSERHA